MGAQRLPGGTRYASSSFTFSVARNQPRTATEHACVASGIMDPEWLAAANTAVDLHQDRIDVGTVLSGGSRTQEGTGRPLLSGLSELPPPHGPTNLFAPIST